MTKKLYKIIIATEAPDYAPNTSSENIIAETGFEAAGRATLDRGEFVDEIQNLGQIDKE